ncbi:hypothetical protein FRC11_012106, partial [Ceratobasidium sp. 423]
GMQYLKDPMVMSKDEVSAMIEHLIAGDNKELPSGCEFHFSQWDKDHFEDNSATHGTWEPQIVYHPDTQAFVAAMEAAHQQRRSNIPEEFVTAPTSSVPYQSFNEAAIAMYRKMIANDDKWWDLQAALSDHDKAYPVL